MMIGGSELAGLSQYLHREYKTSLASMISDINTYPKRTYPTSPGVSSRINPRTKRPTQSRSCRK